MPESPEDYQSVRLGVEQLLGACDWISVSHGHYCHLRRDDEACHLSKSQTVSRYIFSQYFSVTYSGITVLRLSVVWRIAERGSLFDTTF